MMEVKNLSYHYKGCPEVLKDVSFAMQPGQFLAILGNNGVGKSTLLKCFNHILKPDAGEVLLDGQNLLKMSGREVAKQVAFVSQSVPSTQMTVHDVVMLARALAQQPKALLLDEPTSALDIQNQYQVLKIVRDICHKDNMVAVVVIHDLNLALRFCDHFLLLKDVKVYRHGDRSILDSTALKEVYGVDAKVVEIEGRHMVLVEE